ncbi:hypothetical protein D770_15525 [Flammeovirgaceae bacterium 311]|nr:hypothetical protein D770_15525 [Flammeovirgaceae bacterium 311]
MKKPLLNPLLLLLAVVLLQACSNTGQRLEAPVQNAIEGPLRVEIRQQQDGWRLYRGGSLYYINGAGGSGYLDELAARGGNSVRTWSTNNAQEVLDEAHKRGLTVTLGLDVARERHGFDYNDTAAVARQLEKLRIEVQKYKNHPALLIWGIGNELNLHYSNPKVWNAVNDIARMIHEEDPNHPATTMLAGINKAEVDLIKTQVPALDLLAVNAYGDLPAVPQKIRSLGWEKPYIITEWGPTGHWEVAKTAWGAPIEETSSQKAAVYRLRYEASMGLDTQMNLGSYVFLWGQKQERTPTWYGLFTEAGEATEVVDVMQYLWTRSWPQNRAPQLDSLRLDRKSATDNISLAPGRSYTAAVYARDPNGDALSYRWELLPESTDLKEGGDRESRPAPLEGLFTAAESGRISLTAPAQEGPYRLFVYVYDGSNKVATANLPFYVQK